jgi:GNAT superfamily N-acetyltransferase
MSTTVVVRKVENHADFKAFFEFPWTLYKGDPNWVPPLLSMQREMLDKEKNPAWEYLEGDYLAAWRGDQIVGTIAVFINHRHNEYHQEKVAWFGFFECYDDAEVAGALLQAAEEWARSRGYPVLRGPQSFTTHELVGLLIENFSRPVVLMPYNPPYYRDLIEAAGYDKAMDVKSYYYHFAIEQPKVVKEVERLERLAERLSRRVNAQVRSVDRRKLSDEFALFKEIYNDAWEKNWGFTPMTPRELDALVEGLGMIFDPDFACFVEVAGQAVGFMIAVPDFNMVLERARPRPGVPEFWTLLRVLWYWKIRRVIDTTRMPLMGVREEYRQQGLDILMYCHIIARLRSTKSPFRHVDCGWILETNQNMIGVLEGAGLTAYKTYRLFEKSL